MNQLQMQLDKENLHVCETKKCFKLLWTQFETLFTAKKVDSSDHGSQDLKKSFKDYTGKEPQTYKRTDDNRSTKQQDGSSSSGYDADVERARVDKAVSEVEYAAVRISYEKDTLTEVHQSNNDTFENMFSHRIQNHEQPESIPHTYVVNENNSNIIYDIPNIDHDIGTKEHDNVDNEQECALFASLVNNLKCELENCTKVNREAQQMNVLLTKEFERYKEKEKHFAKETTTESEYCKKVKLLNEEISNLKSQGYKKEKTFIKESMKFDEYVQPL
ncbi:hypothetical protein Tco_1135836 [Tanacetum coccineum]